jgi:hypothetical protein
MLSPTNHANKGKDKMGTLKNIAKGFVKEVLNTKEAEKKCSGAAEILVKVINTKNHTAKVLIKNSRTFLQERWTPGWG